MIECARCKKLTGTSYVMMFECESRKDLVAKRFDLCSDCIFDLIEFIHCPED